MTIVPPTLCLHINETFGNIPYPGDEHIVADNSGQHLESENIKNTLKGHHWRDVSFETLTQLRTAIPFLSPDGYRFYLPAFMVFSIVDFERAEIIPYEVILSLTPPRESDLEQIRVLGETQSEAQPFAPDEWQELMQTVTKNYQSGDPQRVFTKRVSGLDLEQRKVIREFLEHMRDFYGDEFPSREPEIALERYFSQL